MLREARARDSEVKRTRVLKTLNEMVAAGEKITFTRLARTAQVSMPLVYAKGLREPIEEAIKNQGTGAASSPASAESLAADVELATAELRTLRAELDRRKTRLQETEAERDRLREALKDAEEKLESALNRVSPEYGRNGPRS